LLALKRPKFQLLRRLASIFAFLFSVYLMSFMFFIVHNLCPFCVISFLLISGFAFLEFVELSKKTTIKLAILLTLGILIVVTGVYFVSLHYQPSEIFEKKSKEFVKNSTALDLDYKKVYNESEKPLLIYIYSTQCPFCEYYASEVLSSSELKQALSTYSFYTLDATLYNGFYKSIETKENSVPMLIIWTKKGKRDFLRGMRKKKDVLEFLHQR